MVNVMGSAAQWERRIISQRTKDALAVKRAQGVRLGRPSMLPREVVERIVRERQGGASLSTIANGLTDEGVPTAHGGSRWWPATVRKILAGQDAATIVPIP
jgi:DNA invertase Pin-like site-specific DNA recombinase